MTFTRVEIVGVVVEDVSSPGGDGSPGSALYAVPIRLSRSLSADEARLLLALWDRPPRFTTMHRPGIARVSGGRIVLDGTTVDEVAAYHASTLSAVVERFNVEAAAAADQEERVAKASAEREEAHRRHVDDIAPGIRFE